MKKYGKKVQGEQIRMRREKCLERKKETLKEEIEQARERLHEALSKGLHNVELYRYSQEMDQLITQYMEETGQEKQVEKQQ